MKILYSILILCCFWQCQSDNTPEAKKSRDIDETTNLNQDLFSSKYTEK